MNPVNRGRVAHTNTLRRNGQAQIRYPTEQRSITQPEFHAGQLMS